MYHNWQSPSIPQATDNVFRLISFLVVSFILQWLASAFLYDSGGYLKLLYNLGLQFNQNFHILQLFSHPFVHESPSFLSGVINLFFTSLVLYFFGSELERTWGSHNFLKFFLFGILGAIVLGFMVSFLPEQNFLYHGIKGGNAAVLIAYAMFWPDRKILFMFFIPMKMKWFIILLFGLLALPGGSSSLIQYSGGALAGALFLYYYARKGRNYSVYSETNFVNYKSHAFSGMRKRWDEYKHKQFMRKKQAEIDERISMKAKVDHLLDKISKRGISSLNRKEKSFLDKASQEL